MTSLSIRTCVCFLAAALLSLQAPPCAHGQSPARYEAAFSDGSRIEGDKVLGWHEYPGSPRLDKTALFDAKRTLRWLRDRTVKPWRSEGACPGYIEFVGGDRLVGRIEGVQPGGRIDAPCIPTHLLVSPFIAPNHQVQGLPEHLRVLPGRIQRVVFGPASRRRLRPGTLYHLDGRLLGFDHLRWKAQSVVILQKDGTREVKFSEISEIHLPRIDPWRAYYRELAVLSPACRSRLMRIETTWGLVTTGSDLRFRATHYPTPAHRRRAMERVRKLDGRMAPMQIALREYRRELDEARAEFARESARVTQRLEAARKASSQAIAQMTQRIDQLRKDDAARAAKERQEMERHIRSADEAMVKQTADAEPQERDRLCKEFRLKQAQHRKTKERQLEGVIAWFKQDRRKALDQFTRTETQKLKRIETDLPKQIAPLKVKVDQAAKHWSRCSNAIERIKSQRVSAVGNKDNSNTWRHMIQPIWSLDALWIPFRTIHTRWSFAPEQVPLCRVRPSATVSPPLLPARTNRNHIGQPLRSGGRQYAWGFAVHAYSELRFPLPKCARTFQSNLGLDRTVGPGGCARARVYVGSTSGKPAYEGPLLVGSRKTVATGRVELAQGSSGRRHLVLQADPADRDSPPGADRLNIRDKLNWLDPQLELDSSGLKDQVGRQIAPAIAGVKGWAIASDRRGDYNWTSQFYETGKPGQGRFLTMLRTQGDPLGLSREITIGPADKWLAVYVGSPTGANPRSDTVALRIGGKRIPPRKIPVRQRWRNRAAPIVFPLKEYQGRKITLELTQPPGKPLHWQAVRISASPPAEYRLVDTMALAGKRDMPISRGLGQTLQSGRVGKDEKLAAIEISKLGGVVNYKTDGACDEVVNIMLGKGWTDGDKALLGNSPVFKRLPGLKTLLVTEYSGVSSSAIAKLQAEMPKLTIRTFLWEIGKADKNYHDLALAGRVMKYARRFPTDPVFVIGKDDARESWPCIHCGPNDGWGGGNRQYVFTVKFDMGPQKRKFYTFKMNLVSAHGLRPPEVAITVNDIAWHIQLDTGPQQDVPAMSNPHAGRPRGYSVTMPSSVLKSTGNKLTITTLQGSWFLYDSLHFIGSDKAP